MSLHRSITANLEPTNPNIYPYVGMSLSGDQLVLFGERCTGVVLVGNNEGEYSNSFMESMYKPIGTTIDLSSNNLFNEKFPLVMMGDDGMSPYFLPYRLYFSRDNFMAFDVHTDNSVSFSGVVEYDFNDLNNTSMICVNINLDFS